jgi:hypothetical protein
MSETWMFVVAWYLNVKRVSAGRQIIESCIEKLRAEIWGQFDITEQGGCQPLAAVTKQRCEDRNWQQ